MARLIIGEKARCKIGRYHIPSGKFGGKKPKNNQYGLFDGLDSLLNLFNALEELELNELSAFIHWGRYYFVYNA